MDKTLIVQLITAIAIALPSAWAVARTTMRDAVDTMETALKEARSELKDSRAEIQFLLHKVAVLRDAILAHERGEKTARLADIEARFPNPPPSL